MISTFVPGMPNWGEPEQDPHLSIVFKISGLCCTYTDKLKCISHAQRLKVIRNITLLFFSWLHCKFDFVLHFISTRRLPACQLHHFCYYYTHATCLASTLRLAPNARIRLVVILVNLSSGEPAPLIADSSQLITAPKPCSWSYSERLTRKPNAVESAHRNPYSAGHNGSLQQETSRIPGHRGSRPNVEEYDQSTHYYPSHRDQHLRLGLVSPPQSLRFYKRTENPSLYHFADDGHNHG